MRSTKLARDVRIAKQTRDARQRLEMIGAGAFRREQQKHQIDRLAVERFEIHRPLQPREQAEHVAELRQLAVRSGDAVADAGGAELLPLQQDFENGLLVLPGEFGRLGGDLLQRLLLPVDLHGRDDRVRRNEIGGRHGWVAGRVVNVGGWLKGGGP